MKPANGKVVVAAVLVGALIGAGISVSLHMKEVHAASNSMTLTGKLAVPGGTPIWRLEDKEYNIVCYGYPESGFYSCTKK